MPKTPIVNGQVPRQGFHRDLRRIGTMIEKIKLAKAHIREALGMTARNQAKPPIRSGYFIQM
jgi:hypothetical protein